MYNRQSSVGFPAHSFRNNVMLCESCQQNPAEVEEFDNGDKGKTPYRVCRACQHRLLNCALRPLEFFNLASIHGGNYLLHDDFYDFDTGEAAQPQIEVEDAEKYPFPSRAEICADLQKLMDYTCSVAWYPDEQFIEALGRFDKDEIFRLAKQKIEQDADVAGVAYAIIGKFIGSAAKDWLLDEWQRLKKEFSPVGLLSDALIACLDHEEAFQLMVSEMDSLPPNELTHKFHVLNKLQDERILDWIEQTIPRMLSVTSNWGTLAAASHFNWQRAEQWLDKGRPLSLIALDALWECTRDRQDMTPYQQRQTGDLRNSLPTEIVMQKLADYLEKDNVLRTRNVIDAIRRNLFPVLLVPFPPIRGKTPCVTSS
jgi:hypothetical protein